MKKILNNLTKYLIIVAGILTGAFHFSSYALELINSTDLDSVAGTPTKEVLTAYAYSAPSYSNFDKFPLDSTEFNAKKDRFCGQHTVAYGVKTGTRTLSWDGHAPSYTLTEGKAGGSKVSSPTGDVPSSAKVYADTNGNLVRNEPSGMYGWIDDKKSESPEVTVVTNWVYLEKKKKFGCCEGGAGHQHYSGGGFAFVLACYIGKTDHSDYQQDPVQWAVWDWINGVTEGHDLDNSAAEFDKYHTASANPNVDCTPDPHVGTVLDGDKYKVGPFKMSNYVRAEDYKLTDGYYTNLQEAFNEKGDFKGTVVKAEAILNDDTIIVFDVPAPNAEFYVSIPIASAAGADELKSIRFTYNRIHAAGAGSLWEGHQYYVTYNMKSHSRGSCSYRCTKDNGSGNCSFSKDPGTSSSPYNSTCKHTWYVNCYDHCCGTHSCSGPSGNNTSCSHGKSSSHNYNCGSNCTHHHGDAKSYTHTTPYQCPTHEHQDCHKFLWQYKSKVDKCQNGFSGQGKLIKEVDRFTVTVNVPLKTVMKIYKYIEKVDHVGESGTIYGLTDSRKNQSMDWKTDNAVWVERGDNVQYKIIITNDSRFDTQIKVKDTLPVNCDVVSIPSAAWKTESGWITVPAHDKKEYTVIVRPTKSEGKDTNTIEFVTTNTGSIHMRYVAWGAGSTHGEHTLGNIVNTDGNNGVTGLKEKDSDTYVIKQYNVQIEKFITDVEHQNTVIGLNVPYDSTMTNQDTRYNKDEATKKSQPVYVEYGDRVTYKIKIYNTTNSYKNFSSRVGQDEKTNHDNPYHAPDKVYVNIEDVLPKKYENLDVTVDSSYQSYSTSGGKFNFKNLMIPKDGITTITVKLTVTEVIKDTIEENKATITGDVRNINYSPSYNVDDKYCVVKDNSNKHTSSDWYKLNYYNASMDKYVYQYNEEVLRENNALGITNEDLITIPTDSLGYVNVLKVSRAGKTDEDKGNHPVGVEQRETLTYALKVVNSDPNGDMSKVPGIVNGQRPATQVRPTKVVDNLEKGLELQEVKAVMYKANGATKKVYSQANLAVTSEDKGSFIKHSFNIDDSAILDPNEYIIYYVTVLVTESNMYLYNLENEAVLDTLTNINSTSNSRIVKNSTGTVDANIGDEDSKEFVRMKDLVISGKVWVDFNRDGKMNDNVSSYAGASGYTDDELKTYYAVNDDAMKKGVVVKLYEVGRDNSETVIRTTLTDETGLFTFARVCNIDAGLNNWLTTTYNHADPYTSGPAVYQRVDKSYEKDGNGNYLLQNDYRKYYIEYTYDGTVYKSDEFYAGQTNINGDGSYVSDYEIDSNAAEFVADREKFNKDYELITYNKALGYNGTLSTPLTFDKTDHRSTLLEDDSRAITARSFIKAGAFDKTISNTDLLWLRDFRGSDIYNPKTDHLKYINLGLELREDVDIALTKDVYKVTTLINGKEIEYDYNQLHGINGNMATEPNRNDYLQDYIIARPYGLEIYEGDYKFRIEQYISSAVRDYLGEAKNESELNIAVTYRINVANRGTNDDMYSPNAENEKVDLRVAEIMDLYDMNFIKYEPGKTIDVKNTYYKDDSDGSIYKTAKEIEDAEKAGKKLTPYLETDPERNWVVGEAWYFDKIESGDSVDVKDRYVISNQNDINSNPNLKPIFIHKEDGDYKRIPLTLSNSSMYSDRTPVDFTSDGYYTSYITGMYDRKIPEEEDFDIYVKYVLDKNEDDEIVVTNEEIKQEASSYLTTGRGTYNGIDYEYKSWGHNGHSELVRNYKKTLKIKEYLNYLPGSEKDTYGRGTENIAQVNAYGVYYTDGKPTALIDMDSNAGNIGKNNTELVIRGSGLRQFPDITENPAVSTDLVDLYEDTAYKTGIEIVSNGTAWDKEEANFRYSGFELFADRSYVPLRNLIGQVWDDSRTDELGSGNEKQYVGDGVIDINDTAVNDAKKNDSVKLLYKDTSVTEEKDINVRSAKVEFIEVVQIDKDTYIEQVLQNVSWDQTQWTRTDENGKYTLTGMTPGRYIVRMTYGDSEQIVKELAQMTDLTQETIDMLIFNGQDYKSSRFFNIGAIDASQRNGFDANYSIDGEENYDNIMKALEIGNVNDGREDEIRRLEVNAYSETMISYIAEILKGLANNTEGKEITDISNRVNTLDELQELITNTASYAETVEFMVEPEKPVTTSKTYTSWKASEIRTENGINIVPDVLFRDLVNLDFDDVKNRTYTINNIDFGIEYRPEAQISLEKEIREIKLTPESNNGEENEPIIDLFFITEGTGNDKIHKIDTNKSIGFEKVQFITNKYTIDELVSKIDTENLDELQGLVYLQVDEEILQGCRLEVLYDFVAENMSEVDRISTNLRELRYRNNQKSQILIKDYESKSDINNIYILPIFKDSPSSYVKDGKVVIYNVDHYTANTLARNDQYYNMYNQSIVEPALDGTGDLVPVMIRNRKKSIISSRNDPNGYYGNYVGYAYYTGILDENLDTISELKFDKILDYIDTDLEYVSEENNIKAVENKYWEKVDTDDLYNNGRYYVLRAYKEHLAKENGQTMYGIHGNPRDIYTDVELTNIDEIQYSDMVVSVSDRIVDEDDPNAALYNTPVVNNTFSLFLKPSVVDTTKSKAYISLPVSKVLDSQEDTDNMSYENIAEVIQYTTLTGRRTNFETTIGNADIYSTKENKTYKNGNSVEYATASFESDTAAVETITLTPPTGLSLYKRQIKDVVETTTKGVSAIAIIAAVVGIGFVTTTVIIRKYKKRRIK